MVVQDSSNGGRSSLDGLEPWVRVGLAPIADEPAAVHVSRPRWPGLTSSESHVAELLALGASTAEIAAIRGGSTKTIDSHRGTVLIKLGLTSRVALARYAIRRGLVSGELSVYEEGPLQQAGKRGRR